MNVGDHIKSYVIRGRIGSGGMSVVYLADNRNSGGQVVVKRLKDEFSGDAEFVSRFRLAAEIMRKLEHPNLAHAIDYVEQNGNCLLVEEYLSGGNLEERMIRGELSEKQALTWCRDILLAVNSAHREAIVHRDLKPGNLMFDHQERIKVTDFGIAKAFGGPRLTRTRSEMGTPAYMSPEQIRLPEQVYHLTDVYSMGVVLYELLTRKLPFDKDTDFETKQAVVKEPPVAPRSLNPDIPVQLERIILKAMHKDMAKRYGGCAEFAAAIDSYLNGIPDGGPGWFARHPFLTFLGLVGIMILLLLLIRGEW